MDGNGPTASCAICTASALLLFTGQPCIFSEATPALLSVMSHTRKSVLAADAVQHHYLAQACLSAFKSAGAQSAAEPVTPSSSLRDCGRLIRKCVNVIYPLQPMSSSRFSRRLHSSPVTTRASQYNCLHPFPPLPDGGGLKSPVGCPVDEPCLNARLIEPVPKKSR